MHVHVSQTMLCVSDHMRYIHTAHFIDFCVLSITKFLAGEKML